MNNELKSLNVYSLSDEEIGRLMSNFANTPFVLDNIEYGSVEGFYVSLLFTDEVKRAKVRRLYGFVAKRMGKKSKLTTTCYGGESFELGSDAHVNLVKRAIRAKLETHPEIAAAFVATAPRPIIHDCGHPEPDNSVFPAAVFVKILTELRAEFAAKLA
jgi:predicted NAD-dependent protein-ADP-ribosyltransferase YbiA (DUF1768 family)